MLIPKRKPIQTGNESIDALLAFLGGGDASDAAMDLVAPMGMARNLGKKVTNAIVPAASTEVKNKMKSLADMASEQLRAAMDASHNRGIELGQQLDNRFDPLVNARNAIREELATRGSKTEQGVSNLQSKLMRGDTKFATPPEILEILKSEDALGFDSSKQAAGAILQSGRDWLSRWEVMSPENARKLEAWREETAKVINKIEPGKLPE
jgi:hypothetical protein|tara:strand:- start:45 stop:671 length:627 start_codon:yes stop_codon:yes gene_type:complete